MPTKKKWPPAIRLMTSWKFHAVAGRDPGDVASAAVDGADACVLGYRSSLPVRGSFGSQEVGRRDQTHSFTRAFRQHFNDRPTARIAMSNST